MSKPAKTPTHTPKFTIRELHAIRQCGDGDAFAASSASSLVPSTKPYSTAMTPNEAQRRDFNADWRASRAPLPKLLSQIPTTINKRDKYPIGSKFRGETVVDHDDSGYPSHSPLTAAERRYMPLLWYMCASLRESSRDKGYLEVRPEECSRSITETGFVLTMNMFLHDGNLTMNMFLHDGNYAESSATLTVIESVPGDPVEFKFEHYSNAALNISFTRGTLDEMVVAGGASPICAEICQDIISRWILPNEIVNASAMLYRKYKRVVIHNHLLRCQTRVAPRYTSQCITLSSACGEEISRMQDVHAQQHFSGCGAAGFNMLILMRRNTRQLLPLILEFRLVGEERLIVRTLLITEINPDTFSEIDTCWFNEDELAANESLACEMFRRLLNTGEFKWLYSSTR